MTNGHFRAEAVARLRILSGVARRGIFLNADAAVPEVAAVTMQLPNEGGLLPPPVAAQPTQMPQLPPGVRRGSPGLGRATHAFFTTAVRRYGDSPKTAEYLSAGIFRATQRAVCRLLANSLPKRLLDSGCSTGLLTAPLPAAQCRVGVDFVRSCLEAAQRRLTAVQADVSALPFCSNAFETCLSVDVIQHLSPVDGLSAVDELARVAAAGSTVLVVTLNGDSLLRRLFRPTFGGAHYSTYTSAALEQSLTLAGVRRLRWVWLFHPLGVWLTTRRRYRLATWVAPSFLVTGIKA